MPNEATGAPYRLQVLAVDDDPSILEMAKLAAEGSDADVSVAESAARAFSLLRRQAFDLVFLDLGLDDRSGAPLLSDVIVAGRGALVAVLTGDANPATIVECMKRGAFDYLAKPVAARGLAAVIARVRAIAELRLEAHSLGGAAGSAGRNPAFDRIATRSPLMLDLFKTIERVARSPMAVLVSGESGVGKELVARAIHDLSGLPGSFVPVNVAGLDDALFADTLFGHLKGAYTGAQDKRGGLVRVADRGTLFLDEIGDLGAEAQVKLLRFLQDGEFYPLGSDRPERSSARLVLATNADLVAKVRGGTFRADLYYRLMIHNVAVPPLRERRGDIPLLVERFAWVAAESFGRKPPARTGAFVAAVEDWRFPGNIRELFSLVFGAMSHSPGNELSASYARDYLAANRAGPRSAVSGCGDEWALDADGRFLGLDEVVDRHMRAALERCGGNQSTAARLLGVSQSTVSRWLAAEAARGAAGAEKGS